MAENNKKSSKVDKLIMGAIIGSAIGSVVGITLAPKSGKETRKIISDKSKEVYEKGKEITQKFKENPKEEISEFSKNAKTASKSFFKVVFSLLKRKKKEKIDRKHAGMKEIPVEEDKIFEEK